MNMGHSFDFIVLGVRLQCYTPSGKGKIGIV